ncbi:MAG: MBL fold metallo-hydrolase [Clostridia bacterium]|nr:MBL fold metallo-hydrolase [Clostridia bacterium]
MRAKGIKLVALLLIGVLTLGAVSCRKSDTDEPEVTTTALPDSTTAPTKTEEEEPMTIPEGHILINGDGSTPEIVYNQVKENALGELAIRLRETMKELSEGTPAVLFSTLAKDNEKLKILIGNTGRSESNDALASLADNTFTVKAVNGSVVIAASNILLYEDAVNYFVSQCTYQNGKLSCDGKLNYTSEPYAEYEIVSSAVKPDIIYAASLTDGAALAGRIKTAIESATGITLNVFSDDKAKSGAEILIGDTNRDISAESAATYVNYRMEYDASLQSLTLTGDISAGVARLEEVVKTAGKTGSLSIVESVLGMHAPDGYGFIPEFKEASPRQVTLSEMNSYYVLFTSQTQKTYLQYAASLDDYGFKKYDTKEVNGNIFSTYTDGYNILHVNYVAYLGNVVISADTIENSSLPRLESDMGEAVTTPQLTQINGACAFIIRLSDGRFIVYDGGLNYEKNYKTIYEQLVSQNVLDVKPIVAAWIFSHPHSDHYGGFLGFTENYASNVTLEQVVFNLPTIETYGQNTEASGTTETITSIIKSFKSALLKYPSAETMIAHAGMEAWYGDALVDILYTHEELAPSTMLVTNSMSVVFTVTIGGQKITFLGDAHNDMSLVMYRMYAKTLKCDIVQVAHHGYNGGNSLMYTAMAADTALWTSPYETVINPSFTLWNNPANNFDVNSVKENLMMADNSVMILPLPHAVGSKPQYARTFS